MSNYLEKTIIYNNKDYAYNTQICFTTKNKQIK